MSKTEQKERKETSPFELCVVVTNASFDLSENAHRSGFYLQTGDTAV